MNISTTDAQGLFTKKIVAIYKERIKPTNFLASFFKPTPDSATLELSVQVQRGSEKMAVDVARGSDGNRNTFSKSTEKIFVPPYFREYFDITSLDFYDRLFGATEISDAMFAQLVNSGAMKMEELVFKIERKYEWHRAQSLQSGIMTFDEGPIGQIDFKRKAESIVDVSGDYFATNSDPFAVFAKGCKFLRTVGKATGSVFNAILGEEAVIDLFNNTKFLARQDLFNMKLDAIAPAQRNAVGADYLGRIQANTYHVDLWTYPQYFTNSAGEKDAPYIEPENVIMLPQNPDFHMSFAAPPQLLEPGQPVKTGAYHFSEYTDEKKRTREYHVESTGMPILTAVDQVYTFKAKATA